jgi:DNA-binding NtrC family response regulator
VPLWWSRRTGRKTLHCVYLSGSTAAAESVKRLMNSRELVIHAVFNLDQARAELSNTGARVLLADREFSGGTWEDAVKCSRSVDPIVRAVVLLPSFEGGVWVETLRRGAYDVVAAPVKPEVLRRIIEGASFA